MHFFAKQYKKAILFDLLRKQNIQKLCSRKGDGIFLSFSSVPLSKKNQQVKNLLILENLALKKAFFKFEKIIKRKQSYQVHQLRSFVPFSDTYFVYNFNKNAVGLIKNLQEFKHEIDPICFSFLLKNFKEIQPLKISITEQKIFLSFYRLFF